MAASHTAVLRPGLDGGEEQVKTLPRKLVVDHLFTVAVRPQNAPPRLLGDLWQGFAPFGLHPSLRFQTNLCCRLPAPPGHSDSRGRHYSEALCLLPVRPRTMFRRRELYEPIETWRSSPLNTMPTIFDASRRFRASSTSLRGVRWAATTIRNPSTHFARTRLSGTETSGGVSTMT